MGCCARLGDNLRVAEVDLHTKLELLRGTLHASLLSAFLGQIRTFEMNGWAFVLTAGLLAAAASPEPPTWPTRLHITMVTTRAGNVTLDDLFYDYTLKKNFILIKHQQP